MKTEKSLLRRLYEQKDHVTLQITMAQNNLSHVDGMIKCELDRQIIEILDLYEPNTRNEIVGKLSDLDIFYDGHGKSWDVDICLDQLVESGKIKQEYAPTGSAYFLAGEQSK